MKAVFDKAKVIVDGEDAFLCLAVPLRDAKKFVADMKDKKYQAEIKEYRKNRSLDANALCWVICNEIANAIGSTKEDVYRKNIREVGVYTPLPIKAEAVEDFQRIWQGHGIGWFTEVIDDSKLPGYKLIFAYQGSSVYSVSEMKRLIDNLIQDAKAVGIEVISESERHLLLEDWGKKDEGGKNKGS
jgi:hypothetical protein